MKLSTNTIEVLKNFSTINSGLYFKSGNVLRTISGQSTILAQATVEETFPINFGIYELNTFLSVMSLSRDQTPELEFDEKIITIKGNSGRSKMKYRCCDQKMIKETPANNIELSNPEVSFTLSAEDFEWVARASAALGSPQIAVNSDGSKVFVSSIDTQNDAANTDALEVAEGNGKKYKIIFKTENLTKVLRGNYTVSISSQGAAHFKNTTRPIEYWIATEAGSNFNEEA